MSPGEFFDHRGGESGKGCRRRGGNARKQFRLRQPVFPVRGPGLGVECDCRPDWRYLAKPRLQPPVQIGDEIMKSDRTNGLAITSKIAGYELFLLEEVTPYET